MKTIVLNAMLITAFLTSSCATTTHDQQYMAIGAGAGIAAVAILGTPLSGVVVGAAAGGAAGYAYSQHSGYSGGARHKVASKSPAIGGALRNPYQSPAEGSCKGMWIWDSQTGYWVCK